MGKKHTASVTVAGPSVVNPVLVDVVVDAEGISSNALKE